MAHEDYVSGRYAGSLRRHLFSEHLGLLDSDRNVNISDPASDFFYREVWLQTAVENTAIYEEVRIAAIVCFLVLWTQHKCYNDSSLQVFHCIPSNQADSFASLKKYQEEIPLSHSDPVAAMKKLEGIKVYQKTAYLILI